MSTRTLIPLALVLLALAIGLHPWVSVALADGGPNPATSGDVVSQLGQSVPLPTALVAIAMLLINRGMPSISVTVTHQLDSETRRLVVDEMSETRRTIRRASGRTADDDTAERPRD